MVLEAEHSHGSIGSDKSGMSQERFSVTHPLRTVRSRRSSRQMKREHSGADWDEWSMSAGDRVRESVEPVMQGCSDRVALSVPRRGCVVHTVFLSQSIP